MTTAAPSADSLPRPEAVRGHLRNIMLAWVFGAGWLALVSGGPMIRFAEEMGLKQYPFTWGLLSAVPYIATFFQLAGSYWIEWTRRRKPIFFVANLLHRSCWLIIALLPYVVLPYAAGAVVSVLALVLLQAIGGHLANPAWTNWMADIIPPRIRGRYFGVRIRLGQLVVAITSLAAGFLLGLSRHGNLLLPLPDGSYLPVTTLQLCSGFFVIAAILGCIDILFFWKVPDRAAQQLAKAPRLREVFGPPLQDARFRRFLLFYFIYFVGAPGIGYYVWTFALHGLNAGDFNVQLMFMVIPPLGEVLIAPTWGRLIDRFGRRRVWLISMIFPSMYPLLWIFITPQFWWLGIIWQTVSMMGWSGGDQCSFNSLLGWSGGRKGSSSYQALYALVLAAGGSISGLMFAGLAYVSDGFNVQAGPVTLHYFAVLFLVSAAIRMGAYLFLLPRVEPRPAGESKSPSSALAPQPAQRDNGVSGG